jgi:hypothetical protein
MYAPYMTVYLLISLPKIPYIHRYMVLANPRNNHSLLLPYRLDPFVEWDKVAQEELVVQRATLAEQGALLHLACAERDALLRENDKIIAHYKKVGAINAVHRFARVAGPLAGAGLGALGGRLRLQLPFSRTYFPS